MESIIDAIVLFWIHFTTAFSMQVFVVSTVLLLIGIGLRVYMNAVQIQHLDDIPLNQIEARHPHLPSKQVILTTFMCMVALYVCAFQTVSGIPPFDGPYESLYLGAVFILSGAAAILAELKWDSAKEYPFAFTIGTSLAFIFLSFKFAIPQGNIGRSVVLLGILLACIVMAKRFLFPQWTEKVQVLSVVTFVGWLLIYIWS